MKRKIGLLTLISVLAFALTACGDVSIEKQNRALPLNHILGEESTAETIHCYAPVTLYGVEGNGGYHYLSGKLYSFTFSTVPSEGSVVEQYSTLLDALVADYGKASSTSDDGVALWSGRDLATTITLTSHTATASEGSYVSVSFCGKFNSLTALNVFQLETAAEFEEEATLAPLLDTTLEEVLTALGSATETAVDEAGTGAVVYDAFRLGQREGVLQVSFYENRSYAATFSLSSVTGSCTPEDYYALSAQSREAHKAPAEEYCLGYAAEGGVSQTQYQMWKNVKNKFTAELIYYASPDGDVLQYSLTASWMLSNRPAMQAVMGE